MVTFAQPPEHDASEQPPVDATQLALDLAAGIADPLQLARDALERIDALNADLHVFTHVDRDGAARAAEASRARQRAGQRLSGIDGLPVAIKASIAVQGWPHTAGLKFRRDVIASTDAFLVQRLRAAGAVLIGATNMDEGALGATGRNPWYGDVANPLRGGHASGGSSGGSAAAVAAGLVPIAIGSDTLGSIRIPAAYCGVYGIKPTFGAIGMRGVVNAHHRFDHAGPIAASARDLLLALGVLVAQDPQETTSIRLDLGAGARRGPLRIGIGEGFEAVGVAPPVQEAFEHAASLIGRTAHACRNVSVAHLDLDRARRTIFALCEIEMARMHGERLATSPQDFSPPAASLLTFGARQTGADVDRFERRFAEFQAAAIDLFRDLDVLVLPTTPQTAYAYEDAAPPNNADFTCFASATGMPALTMPLPHAAGDLPAGLQLIGRPGSEYALVSLAAELDPLLHADA